MPLSASAALRFEGSVGWRLLGCCVFSLVVALRCRCYGIAWLLGAVIWRSLTAVVVPASFGVVDPEIPPLPSFPRSPGKKGDGSLGGPLASAKGTGSSQSDSCSTLCRGPCRAGSLTGAVRLSNGNAGVPRRAQRGRKPRVEQKGKSSLDLDFQYEYGPRKRGPSILSARRALSAERCQKSYHRDNWLVAAKRS